MNRLPIYNPIVGRERPMPNGFTLIELLVVISIIVLLLSLLAPSMDKAIYQAELATCSANLAAIVDLASLYALENDRKFPDRKATNGSNGVLYGWTNQIVDVNNQQILDDRPLLQATFGSELRYLHDPLTGGDIEFSDPTLVGNLFVDYELWFSVKYQNANVGSIRKLGDRMNIPDASGASFQMTVLASDQDAILEGTNNPGVMSSHPDDAGLASFMQYESPPWTYLSRWERITGWERGKADYNYAMMDGSVQRETSVPWKPENMVWAPFSVYSHWYPSWRYHLPKP